MATHVRVCRDCGEEYRPEVVRCADCGGVLEYRFEGEPEEEDVMARPPRPATERLFSRGSVARAILQGAVIFLFVSGLFVLTLRQGRSDSDARTTAFSSLVVANLAMILIDRSRSRSFLASLRLRNTALWAVVGGASGLLAIALAVPSARELFGFSAPRLADLGGIVALGAGSVLWLEALRAFRRRRSRTAAAN